MAKLNAKRSKPFVKGAPVMSARGWSIEHDISLCCTYFYVIGEIHLENSKALR